ncbi:MAG: glycosyltransferase family 4 protein, partial [Proteobacteria bacterium]|nr:glycosyltransferase family 4 protein [Pseudomonadota bacterium]
MRITYIGCPFKTSYGSYVDSLKTAIENRTSTPIQWVASNCGCGDPIERSRLFQARQCDYFEMRHIGDYRSPSRLKYWLRMRARNLAYYFRARKYTQLSGDAELTHLQQILNAYGSSVAFQWLRIPSQAAKVVTVHELDSYQTSFPRENLIYNRADALIVHCQEMRDKLISLGVRPEKISIVLHGVDLPTPVPEEPREGVLFYGGHKLMTGKGLETLFEAMALLERDRDAAAPRLTIHGHYGTDTPQEALELAERHGVSDRIIWRNQLSEKDGALLYSKASVLVLPYTGSFAGLPAGLAASRGTPVIATRKAGIPDHLGENVHWVKPGNAKQLADQIAALLDDEPLRRAAGSRLRQHAAGNLSWDIIGARTLEIYATAIRA